ncbi:tripartite motif-containing protein 16-like [Limanda limanda]|uniref:tripartite motif-containing protein 16-like n=1 Tax=Limanda limanda TaxID=27771 RepID=UPI0029C728E5|nr:tripartite motif-containing protein 16-like [Limanda limanda]XP_060922092.1 tripartite motif-containing protein 16-like [Limanda limanda]XP_060922093.1 tripartite motif-containing protein 16-like [Limanda limanda]XP_060922095.1 tripartite motif-containing protein 16-like [Limanda limanda]
MSGNQQRHRQQVVLCDICTEDDRKPARKTCMKCEISMCGQHLQVHLTTPVLLQTHPLTEPMALCSTTKCPQHGKLLEYYCLDDMTCVCVSCAIEDQHRLHNMKTFSTAHKELMEKLPGEQKALGVKTDDENGSLEKWENSEREKLSNSSLRLIEAVTKMRDMSLTSVRTSVSARMGALKTSKSSLQVAQSEKDTFRFLQMYSQVHQDVEEAKAVDLRKGLLPNSDRDKLVQEIRQNGENMMDQAEHFWGSLFTLIDPDQDLLSTGPDLMFEPQVLGSGMSLSKDNRRVFHSSWIGECTATLWIGSTQPDYILQRWQVFLSKDFAWTIGLCDKNSRKDLKKGPIYGLCYKNNQLSSVSTDECFDASSNSRGLALQTEAGRQPPIFSAPITHQGDEEDEEAVPRPEKVEVFWNSVASSLSFFRRRGLHRREEIVTIAINNINWDLVPFVQLEMKNAQKSANSSQIQWKCPCGRDYNNQANYYSQQYGNVIINQKNCACGEILGGRFTEVVCELV